MKPATNERKPVTSESQPSSEPGTVLTTPRIWIEDETTIRAEMTLSGLGRIEKLWLGLSLGLLHPGLPKMPSYFMGSLSKDDADNLNVVTLTKRTKSWLRDTNTALRALAAMVSQVEFIAKLPY